MRSRDELNGRYQWVISMGNPRSLILAARVLAENVSLVKNRRFSKLKRTYCAISMSDING